MVQSLKSELKILGRHSFVYSLSNILGRMVSFILLPLYTRYLTPGDYGVLEILYFVSSIISILSLIVSLLLYFVSGTTSELVFGSREYLPHFQILYITLFTEFTIQFSLAYFRVEKRSTIILVFSLIRTVLTLSLNILFLVHYNLGAKGILLGSLVANGLTGIVMVFMVLWKTGFGFSPPLVRDMLLFGLPLIPSRIAAYIIIASDRYFIKEFVSLNRTGIYSLGYKLGSMMSQFITSPFIQIWFPRRFEHFNRGDSERIFAKIFTYFTAMLVFTSLGVALFAREIVMIMTTAPYWDAYKIVPLIVLAHIFHSFYYHFSVGITYYKKTKYFAYINIYTGILNLILNYFLITSFGIWGAAYSTLITYVIRAMLVYYYSNKLFPIIFEKIRIYKIIFSAGAIYFMGTFISVDNLLYSIVLKSVMLAAFPLLLYLTKFFSRQEITEIRKYADKVKRFFNHGD
jgi:O-antigen/teichoic acid export membrane protein